MEQPKPRVVKDFDRLDATIQEQIKLVYPFGFSKHLVTFTNKEGRKVSALPFETDEKYYLVRMTVAKAHEIIADDDDFDEEGNLRVAVRENYEDKYADLDYIADSLADEEEEVEEEEEED